MIKQYQEKTHKNASFDSNISDQDFRLNNFTDFSAVDREIVKCNFSYAVFLRVYFRKVKFTNCDFTGAKFFDSNLRDAEFVNCKFPYASFKFTIIKSSEVLKNLPEWPNVKTYLLQIHKANANSLGDIKSSRTYLLEEIEANKEHLRRATSAKEGYYSTKYGSFPSQVTVRWKRFLISLDDLLWGHGESPYKIIRNVILSVLIIAIFQSFANDNNFFMYVGNNFKLFLGMPGKVGTGNSLITGFLILLRYLTLGLFIRVLFNKYSWR